MLQAYLNQTALYKPLLDVDNRGQPVYGDETVVPCRRQTKTQEIITPDKQTIKVEHVYYLAQSAKEGDSLDGRRVQYVAEMVGLGGTVIGYKAVV
jgi:hypothetical protein